MRRDKMTPENIHAIENIIVIVRVKGPETTRGILKPKGNTLELPEVITRAPAINIKAELINIGVSNRRVISAEVTKSRVITKEETKTRLLRIEIITRGAAFMTDTTNPAKEAGTAEGMRVRGKDIPISSGASSNREEDFQTTIIRAIFLEATSRNRKAGASNSEEAMRREETNFRITLATKTLGVTYAGTKIREDPTRE